MFRINEGKLDFSFASACFLNVPMMNSNGMRHFSSRFAEARVASSVGPDVESRVGPASVVGPGEEAPSSRAGHRRGGSYVLEVTEAASGGPGLRTNVFNLQPTWRGWDILEGHQRSYEM